MITAKYAQGYTSELIHTGPCKVTGFYVMADTVACEVYLYDGVDSGGVMFRKAVIPANTDTDYPKVIPVEFKNGIYVDVVTAPNFWTVEYII